MEAIVIHEPGDHGLDTLRDPAPAERESVVAAHAVGICGTDLHMVTHPFGLDDFAAAVDAVRTRRGLKVQVTS